MPTFYKRKRTSTRGEWTEESLRNAVSAVQNDGMSLNMAARTFGVPWSTLKRRITNNCLEKKSLGPSSLLGIANEKKIVQHIKKMQKYGFTPTRSEVRSMAYKLAEQLQIKHNFNKTTELAGIDWLHLFLNRNSELSIRKSEGTSQARAQNMNKENVTKYFDLLQDILVKHDLLNKPGHIYNIDETGLQLNNKPGYVVAAKGSKSVSNVTSGEKGETISVIACCNGEGMFLPPACIFKGKNEKPEFKDGMPPGSVIYMSQKSAYVTGEIFFLWLRNHFLPRKPPGTVLLILDGHSSHCNSVEMLEFAEEHSIILLCLPSHTTHYLQPLDRSFFKSFKAFYYTACNVFMKANPTRKINRPVFGRLLNEAWSKAATVSNGISGFRATGIVPFNPHIIPDYAFLVDVQSQADNPQPGPSHQVPTGTVANILQPGHSHQETTRNVANHSEQGSSHQAPLRNVSAELGPSNISSTDSIQSDRHENCSVLLVSTNPNDDITPGKMLDNISPVPNLPRVEAVRKRSRNLASVLNSESNIKNLKEKVEEKRNKVEKAKSKQPKTKSKTKAKATKLDMSDTSDEESEPELGDDDVDEVEDDNDYCIGCGEEYKYTKKVVDWIKCARCQRWLHEDCTKYGKNCDMCGKFLLKHKKI